MEGVGTAETPVLDWIRPGVLPTTPSFGTLDLSNSCLVNNLSLSTRCRILTALPTTATTVCLRDI